MGLLTDQITGENERPDNPVEPAGNSPLVAPGRPAAPSSLVRDVLGETEEVSRLGVATRTAAAIPPERAARTLELGDKTRLPLDLIQRNFDEVDSAARSTDFDPVKFRAESPAVAKWMAEDPNNAAMAQDDLESLSMTEKLVGKLRSGVINRSYDLTVAQTRLGKLRARQLDGQVLTPDEEREAENLSQNMGEMGRFAESGLPWVAKTVLSGGIQSIQAVGRAQDMALMGAAGGGAAALIGGVTAPLAPATASTGYGFGLQVGLMRETYQVEAGQAYDEFLKIRGEDGQQIDPGVAKVAAKVVGALNAPLELLAFRSIIKTIPGGARALSFMTKDGIKAALEKQSIRTAIATALKTFGEAGVENAAQEALQETVTILAAETGKALSPGKFESPTAGEQVKRVAGAAAGGAVMGLGLGLPGTISQINADFTRARQAAQNEATFKALGEAMAESKTFQRLPAKTQEIVARMTKDGPLATIYAPVESWNTYWQEKGIEPRAMAREVLGDVKAYDEAVASGQDISIPTSIYATKLAATEHNQFFQSEIRTDPDGMNAREANEFIAQIEAVSAEADVTKPVNEAAGRVGADIQLQLQASGFDEQTAATYSQLYASAFQAMGERTGQDPFALYEKYGLKISRGDEATLGGRRGRAAETSDLQGPGLENQELQPQSGAVPAGSIDPTIQTQAPQTATPPAEVAPGKGAAQAGLPVHGPAQAGQVAESSYRLKVPFSESITSHPQFRKYFSDSDAVVKSYAEFFGKKPTAKFALEIGEVIHQDFRAMFTGKTAEEKAAAKKKFEKKYEGLDANEIGKDMLLLRSVAQAVRAHAPGVEQFSEEYVAKGLSGYDFSARPLSALKADPDVMSRAKSMLRQAEVEREDKVTDLERFIVDNGGLKMDESERGEFVDVPVRLRAGAEKGGKAPDVMEQDARDAGLLGPNDNLYGAVKDLASVKRGEKPVLTDFIVEAAREQEHDQEFFQDLFETQAAGAGQRYESYTKVATDRGLSGIQARKFALDRLAREGGKPEASPTAGTQLEIGDPEGVKSFGKGARGQSELFQDAAQDAKRQGPPRAVFLGWQDLTDIGEESFPLYNVRGEHPKTGSTVGADTLRSLGIEIPATPSFDEWKAAGSKVSFDQPAADNSRVNRLGTAAFKKWFGDSKVVDRNGQPLVLYHGTSTKGLKGDVFDKGLLGLVTKSRSAKAGFYFVDKRDIAEGYSRLANEAPVQKLIDASQKAEREQKWNLANELMAKAEKLEIKIKDKPPKEHVVEAYLSIKDPYEFDAKGQRFMELQDEIHDALEMARNGGHDGVVFRNLVDVAEWGKSDVADHWVAFEPTQIKSATGNSGAFDPEKQSILEQPPTWKLKKIKDFKTDEGKFSVYGTDKVRGKDSMFTVIRDKGGFIVRNALVPDEMRRQGLATEIYIRMNGESMKETGNPLRSTQARTLSTGERVHEVSDEAVALWDSFVKKGWAVKNGEKDYAFKPEAIFSQRKGEEKRGRIRFGADRQFSIDLLKKADLSTFLHESGHFFLEVMGDLAKDEDSAPELYSDYQEILKFLDVKSREGIGRDQHEKFARSFEAYLMEGRAPSPALRQAFARFRAWLISVYQTLKSLNTELTPEVRNVFDRLVATKEEIGQAEAEAQLQPLFDDPRSIGMNETKAQAYAAAIAEARDSAEEDLTARVLRDFNRERKKIWKDTRDQIQTDVEAQVNQRKDQIALSVLQRGTFPGGEALPEGMAKIKLSKAAIVAQWGPERLKELPMPYTYTADGGVHPDQAAEIFGFSSGDELLKALVSAPRRKDLIEAMTDEGMRAEFGDVLKDGKVPEEAMKAVHGKKRAQLLQMELEHLASNDLPVLKEVVRRVSRRIPPLASVTAQAERIIAAKAVRDLAPTAYRQAETRAARAATEAMLRGDFAAAFDAKQKELLNHELFMAATRAREEVEGIVEYMGKFNRTSVRERMGKAGGDYLEQIDSILDRYDFRRSTTLKEVDRRKSLLAWVQEQKDQGYDVDLPEKLLNDAYRRSYKETPFEELQGVRDSVKTIEHLARLKSELLANEKMRDLEAARDEIVASITAHHKIEAKPLDFAPDLKTRIKEKVREGVAAHTRMEFLFEFLDGNKPQGPVWQALFKPLADAENVENDMVHKAGKAVNEIFDVYTRKERINWFLEKTHIPEIGTSMNRANMLAVALNLGNDYNRQALMDGYGWSEDQVNAITKKLDRRDWDTVQKIWDYLDTYWAEAETLEKEINGVAPRKVESTPFAVEVMGADRPERIDLRGGYYHIAFDAKISWRQSVLDEAASVGDMFGGNWAKAMTRNGALKERKNSGGKPVLLNLSVLTQHLTAMIHDLAFRRAVIDVSKIARDPDVRLNIEGAAGREMYRQINPWLTAIAGDRRGEPMNPIEGLLGRARAGVTTVALGLKLSSGVIQTLGYFNTIKEVGAEYAGRGLRDAFSSPTEIRKTWAFVTDRSAMMRSRIENYDRDVRDTMKKLSVEGATSGPLSAMDAYTHQVRQAFFSFIGMMDLGVSIPTWLAGYRKAMDGKVENVMPGDEAAATDYADTVVRKTQSAGASKDLAAIQRGSEAFKIFTMFYSQLSLQFNQMASSVNQYRLDKDMGRLAGAAALLWFLPAVMEDVLRGRTPGADDEPEKWATWFARKQVLYPFNTVVLVRDLANSMERYLDTGTKDFGGSPVFDVGESLVGLAALATKPLTGEDISRGDVKNAVMATGYIFQLPTRQTWQTAEYLYDWMTGEQAPESVIEGIWRAMLVGKKKG